MASAPVPVNEELRAPLAEVRKDLLDFGLRNPLLNYRLLKTLGLEVPGMAPAEVFRVLVTEGAELSFLGVEEMLRTGSSFVLVEQSFGMAAEDVAIATCRLLGFARVSEEMRAVVEEQWDSLFNNGKLEFRGETLVLNRDRAL